MKKQKKVTAQRSTGKKLDVKKFALTAGIYFAAAYALVTICGLLKLPGYIFPVFVLVQVYGAYGYSISPLGIFIGALWGFLEGFIHFGIFAWLYNKLLG